MALEHIVAETFYIRENVALAIRLLPFVSEEDKQDDVYVHAVYPRGKPDDAVYVYSFQGPKADIVRNFKTELGVYIDEYRPQRLIDYLFFLCTYCPVSEKPSVYSFKEFKFTPDPYVADILKDTHGFLLFDYQLEQLISLFQRDEDAAIRTRQGLNRRDSLVEDRARRMLFENGKSLLDVFNERVQTNFTIYPPMRAAKTLMETISL